MREEILEKIKEAGVVGAGGAGFPTHVKLSSPARSIIVNCAECEPLLKVDQQLAEFMTAKMLRGLEAALEITAACEGIIAIKKKYTGAIDAIKSAISSDTIKLHVLQDFYPAGDEQVTVYETTKKIVPQGSIPLKVDCIVMNVETLINVAAALDGKPVTHKYLTLTGEVPDAVTVKLPVGTSVAEALRYAGVKNLDGFKVIEGGPMMGKLVHDINQPITKTTKGLIVLPADHPLIVKRTMSVSQMLKLARTACIQCRYCTDLCPRYMLGNHIQPHKIMRSLQYPLNEPQAVKMAFACSECGVCEQFACTMGLSPRRINAVLKQELSKAGIKPDNFRDSQQVDNLREYRKVPVKRLITRLGIHEYNHSAPFNDTDHRVKDVALNLKQHIGAFSKPLVAVGQKVRKGQLIAAIPENVLGAPIHASIGGVVTAISGSQILIKSARGSETQ